jgi:hypothetical protein
MEINNRQFHAAATLESRVICECYCSHLWTDEIEVSHMGDVLENVMGDVSEYGCLMFWCKSIETLKPYVKNIENLTKLRSPPLLYGESVYTNLAGSRLRIYRV